MESQISDYEQQLEWLYSQLPMFSRVGAAAYKPGLDNTLALDALFGHPHRKFKSIHVGGTNGKGSTSHMIAACLQAQGYKTALYTSPHLTDFRERIRIDGKMIPKEEVAAFIKKWRETESELRPSFFELTMMMAFCWFESQKVDYAVIEVGMGGRLDSTNVISPLLSIITNISFDHTQFLGDTLEKIASEKAGIIKPGIPVVIGEAEGEVRRVFLDKASELDSPIFFAQDEEKEVSFVQLEDGWEVLIKGLKRFFVPLGGEYQKANILTVLCVVSTLNHIGVFVSEESTREGLANVQSLTGLTGRWQKLRDDPVVICDTGHNFAGISEAIATLGTRYPGRKLRFVIGFVNDKDVSNIVSLFPKDGAFYFTKAQIPRAMPVEDVADQFAAQGISGTTYPEVGMAYRAAKADSSPSDVIYVGGSTFIVADLLSQAL